VATNGNDIVCLSNGSVVAGRATEPRGVLENHTNRGVNRELNANEDDITVINGLESSVSCFVAWFLVFDGVLLVAFHHHLVARFSCEIDRV